jgi:hypothetical protein
MAKMGKLGSTLSLPLVETLVSAKFKIRKGAFDLILPDPSSNLL